MGWAGRLLRFPDSDGRKNCGEKSFLLPSQFCLISGFPSLHFWIFFSIPLWSRPKCYLWLEWGSSSSEGERGGLLSTLASHTHKPQSLFSSYSSPFPFSSKDSAASTLLLFSSPSSPNALSRFFSTKKERKGKFPPPTNFPAAIVSSRGGGP